MKSLIQEIIADYIKVRHYSNVGFVVEYPPDENFGDYSTNVAMLLAKSLKSNPVKIAQDFHDFFKNQKHSNKFDIKIEKPGFINFFIKEQFLIEEFLKLYTMKEGYFQYVDRPKEKIQIEFVSANPTGPLHIGHGRGAAIGDSLARILSFLGYDVTKEYYINDAGYQMHLLGLSTFLRYKELLGEKIDFPEDCYQGDYIKDIAKSLVNEHNNSPLNDPNAIYICLDKAQNVILDDIINDLEKFRVNFDLFFRESSLFESHEVEQTLNLLKESSYTYEQDGALWLKTTEFGDDKDRVLVKNDGKYTYFASDSAYHRNKFLLRHFDKVVDIWGSDHHGYVQRVKAAMKIFKINPDKLNIMLVQFVNLIKENNKLSMSTRKAQYIELKELINDVGIDAARYIFVSKSLNSHLDIDVELLKKHSLDNPVYYVQYAYARIMSILEKADDFDYNNQSKLNNIKEYEEFNLIKATLRFKDYLYEAQNSLEPYFITKSLLEIAERLHQFYNKHKVITQDKNVSKDRILLIKVVAFVLGLGLSLIGVQAKDKM